MNSFSMAAKTCACFQTKITEYCSVLVSGAGIESISLSHKDLCLKSGPLAIPCQTSALWDDELWKITEPFHFNRAV